MNCPKCDSSQFYYVQRVYEYHWIDRIEDGSIELSCLDDAAVDSGYMPHLRCEDCGIVYDLDLNPIELDESDEPCVPIKVEVRNEIS